MPFEKSKILLIKGMPLGGVACIAHRLEHPRPSDQGVGLAGRPAYNPPQLVRRRASQSCINSPVRFVYDLRPQFLTPCLASCVAGMLWKKLEERLKTPRAI